MLDLSGKAVIVTGSGRGIGRGIAQVMAALGARVAINDLDGDSAEKTAGEIRRAGGTAIAAAGDVTSPDQVAAAVEKTIKEFNTVDILVNNAGIIGLKAFGEITLEEWNRMFAVHLTGSFLFSQAVIPHMRKSGAGKIINIASNWGQRGAANAVHYSTVKAGVIGYTKALARELASENIMVNAVAPGPIETEMIEEEARLLNTTVQEVRNSLTGAIPLNRLGSIDDVAYSVAFLAGRAGNFYCGQVISPNGGEVI